MPQPLPACIQRPAILLLREPMGPQAAYHISNSAACRSLVFCREKVETVATIPRASGSELVLRPRASQLAPLDCTKHSVACPTSALAALSGA